MKVIDPGHVYDLASLDGGKGHPLIFVKREGERYPGNVGSHPGTTTQEVLRALLNRARYVYAQIPCVETEAMIGCLQQALLLCEIRAARVKDKHLEAVSMLGFEYATVCKTCGHVACDGHDISLGLEAPQQQPEGEKR